MRIVLVIIVAIMLVAAVVIFLIPEDGVGNYRVLHHFSGAGGSGPSGTPLLSSNESALFGTAFGGGAQGFGTLYRLDVPGGAFTLLRSYDGVNGSQPTQGVVFSSDGSQLYGLTTQGGSLGTGVGYGVGLNGSSFAVLASMGGSNGSSPMSQPVLSPDGGTLFGTATQSGQNGLGTIFSISTLTGELTVLHQFQGGTDGASPYSPLLLGADGVTLYGMTLAGGNGYGTIYRLGLNGSDYAVIHSFSGYDGALPRLGGLIQDPHGILYGMTSQGGLNGHGTLFSLHSNGDNFTMLHSFAGSDGSNPLATLIYSNSTHSLYGTASQGGKLGQGTLFQLDAAGDFKVLFDFVSALGAMPSGGLALDAKNGILYGTASGGGSAGLGVIYSYTISATH
jgi:uncharacterized repeat protein (TIGR03803 family)